MSINDDTDCQVLYSPPSIQGFSETEISLYQEVSENNLALQEKCKSLEAQLNSYQSLSSWCQGIVIVGILLAIGFYFGRLFSYLDVYQQGYADAKRKVAQEICAMKYPRSVSAFDACVRSR